MKIVQKRVRVFTIKLLQIGVLPLLFIQCFSIITRWLARYEDFGKFIYVKVENNKGMINDLSCTVNGGSYSLIKRITLGSGKRVGEGNMSMSRNMDKCGLMFKSKRKVYPSLINRGGVNIFYREMTTKIESKKYKKGGYTSYFKNYDSLGREAKYS